MRLAPIFLILIFVTVSALADCISGDCIDGRGTYLYSDGGRYEGEWVNGQATGHGVLYMPGNGRYEGHFLSGVYHGEGILYAADEKSFRRGIWLHGKLFGPGAESDSNGLYEGSFRDDKRHGPGAMTYPNGDRFVGVYVNGLRHGDGLYTYNDGTVYDGDFREDKMSGVAVIQNTNGERYVGEVLNGAYHGKGELFTPDGNYYTGAFRNGLFDGYGEFRWASSSPGCMPWKLIYKGAWKAGEMSGSGKMFPTFETPYDVIDGKRVN